MKDKTKAIWTALAVLIAIGPLGLFCLWFFALIWWAIVANGIDMMFGTHLRLTP